MKIWVVEWLSEEGWRMEEALDTHAEAREVLDACRDADPDIQYRVRAYQRIEGSK